MTSSLTSNPDTYQTCGTATILSPTYAPLIIKRHSDPLERFTYVTLTCSKNQKLTIFNVYQPCPSNGPQSTYMQQVLHFESTNRFNINPRHQLFLDLASTILSVFSTPSHHFLILIDANKDIRESNSETVGSLAWFLSEIGNPSDCYTYLHNSPPSPSVKNSTKIIDYAFSNASLTPYLIKIHQDRDGPSSDHSYYLLDIATPGLIISNYDKFPPDPPRCLYSKNPINSTTYTSELTTFCKYHRILPHLQKLH